MKSRNMKRIIITVIIFSIMLFSLGFAAKKASVKDPTKEPVQAYPTGCSPIGFKFSNGVLVLAPVHKAEAQQQVIYFIQNKSKQDILFTDQRDSNLPYIMHNNNSLKSNLWAVFAADSKTKFICSKTDKAQTVQSILDCEDLVKVCEYANVKFALNNRGNYWATSNMSMSEAIREIVHQGILLKS